MSGKRGRRDSTQRSVISLSTCEESHRRNQGQDNVDAMTVAHRTRRCDGRGPAAERCPRPNPPPLFFCVDTAVQWLLLFTNGPGGRLRSSSGLTRREQRAHTRSPTRLSFRRCPGTETNRSSRMHGAFSGHLLSCRTAVLISRWHRLGSSVDQSSTSCRRCSFGRARSKRHRGFFAGARSGLSLRARAHSRFDPSTFLRSEPQPPEKGDVERLLREVLSRIVRGRPFR